MITLFKQIDVYAPEHLGVKDVLVAGKKVIAVKDEIISADAQTISGLNNVKVKVLDGKGLKLMPGLIDAHVHIAGAGGEGGPSTRTPELQLSMLLEAGVTGVVGCLGTDGFGRSLDSVLMKVKALRAEGVSAWMYTGSYQVPPPTLLGSVGKDITMIDEVIGVGEIALSDHRSSTPTMPELVKLTEHARVGGMLGGKAGIVNIHMGDAKNPFKPLYDAVANSELKLKQFLPTHCNRNDYIFEDAKTYGKEGYVDITTSSYPYFPEYEIKPANALKQLLEAGVPIEHITFTSDACGSLPDFDPKTGELTKLEMGMPSANLRELKDAVLEENIPLDTAVKVLTSNVADILKLKEKGRIQAGKDADILVVNNTFKIVHLMANGELMTENGQVLRKGAYE